MEHYGTQIPFVWNWIGGGGMFSKMLSQRQTVALCVIN